MKRLVCNDLSDAYFAAETSMIERIADNVSPSIEGDRMAPPLPRECYKLRLAER
jgi:hypothetical protein